MTIGGSACPASTITHTEITCVLPAGQGLDQPVVVTVSGQASAPFDFDYDPPVISGLDPTSGPESGGIELTVEGTNFGTIGTVTVGGASCPIISHQHSQIVCTLPPGTGIQSVEVVVSEQTSNSHSFGYLPVAVPAARGLARLLLVALILSSALRLVRMGRNVGGP